VTSPPPPGPSTHPPPALVYAITVTGILANTLINPAVPEILDDLGVPEGRAGVLVAAATLPGIVVAPVIGLLADRYGRRAVLVPCLVGFGVFGVLGGLAPTFGALLGLRLLQGVCSAGLINLAVVIIGDHWDGAERTGYIGRNSAVLTISLAIFPPVGGLLTDVGGWRWSFAPYAVGLATAVVVWRRLPAARAHPDELDSPSGQLRSAIHAMRSRRILLPTALGFVVFFLIFGLFLTAMPLHLEREFGLSAGVRGLVLAVPAATATTTALVLASLRRRHGAGRLVAGAFVLFGLAAAAIGVAPSLVVLVVAALGYGTAEGVLIPTLQDLVTGAAPPASRGAVVAGFVGVSRAGQTVGPLVAGATLAAVGTGSTFVLGGAVAGLTGVAVTLVGRRLAVVRRARRTDPDASMMQP
jgi:MFS family permease